MEKVFNGQTLFSMAQIGSIQNVNVVDIEHVSKTEPLKKLQRFSWKDGMSEVV